MPQPDLVLENFLKQFDPGLIGIPIPILEQMSLSGLTSPGKFAEQGLLNLLQIAKSLVNPQEGQEAIIETTAIIFAGLRTGDLEKPLIDYYYSDGAKPPMVNLITSAKTKNEPKTDEDNETKMIRLKPLCRPTVTEAISLTYPESKENHQPSLREKFSRRKKIPDQYVPLGVQTDLNLDNTFKPLLLDLYDQPNHTLIVGSTEFNRQFLKNIQQAFEQTADVAGYQPIVYNLDQLTSLQEQDLQTFAAQAQTNTLNNHQILIIAPDFSRFLEQAKAKTKLVQTILTLIHQRPQGINIITTSTPEQINSRTLQPFIRFSDHILGPNSDTVSFAETLRALYHRIDESLLTLQQYLTAFPTQFITIAAEERTQPLLCWTLKPTSSPDN